MNQTLVVPGERIHDTEDNNSRRCIFVGGCVCTFYSWKGSVFLFFAMYSYDLNKTTTTKHNQTKKKPTTFCVNVVLRTTLLLLELVDINYYWWD